MTYSLKFREWPILIKIIPISIISVTIITLIILLYFMLLIEQKILEGKEEGLKNGGRNRSVRFTVDMWRENQV